jgi:hypothetical protein
MTLLWLRILVLLSCCACELALAEAKPYVVIVRAVSPDRVDGYYAVLLKMLLEASKKPRETIEIHFSDREFSQARWIAEVQTGQLNEVMWTTTSIEREELLRPIRVPIFRGLLGKRVLVIRRQDQEIFAKINSKEDLTRLVAGQNVHWSDTDILKANGLMVTGGGGKESLYKMLQASRFVYFPRGVTELASEVDFLKGTDLIVEQHLMLSYTMPIYFFVSKDNSELARRLEKGWQIILKSGEFDKFFFNHPRIKTALADLKMQNRKIIQLDNPYLPATTPLNRAEYWLDVGK